MRFIHAFFTDNGYVFEILLAMFFFTGGLKLRKNGIIRLFMFITGILTLSVIGHLIAAKYTWYMESFQNVLFFLICTFGTYYCYKLTLIQSAFCITAVGAAQHLCFKTAKIFCMIMITKGYRENSIYVDIIYLTAVFILEICCGLFFGKKLRRHYSEISTSSISILILFIGMQLCTNLFHNLFNEYSVELAPYIIHSLFDIICCLFLLALQCEIIHKEKEKQNNAIMQHLLYQQKQQMKLSRETIDLINIKCHDIKNQIAMLGNRIPEDELDELNRAINIYDTGLKSGNEALDILLMEKTMQCENKKIRVSCIISGELLSFMKPSDIYALFGNAIDNAMEAVNQIDDGEKRCINIRVKESKGMVLIHVENYYIGELLFEGGLPKTTKRDKLYHGFGMKSIQMIVDKYHGYFSAKANGGIFSLDILFPILKNGDLIHSRYKTNTEQVEK